MTSNTKKTYCSELWSNITINKYGDVYNCCLLNPGKIGNIKNNSISELINNDIAINFRELSLLGNLECYEKCTLVNKDEIDQNKHSKIDINDLKTIHISCSEACNINCIMCNHPKRDKINPVELPFSSLSNIDFKIFDNIIIQGGEPLYIKSCLELIDYLSKNNLKFILLTNGLLIDNDIAKNIAKNGKSISISINSATKETHKKVNISSDFNKILENIEKIKYYRNKFKTDVIIFGRFTIVKQNLLEIPMFIEKYNLFGFDKINFGFDNPSVPNFLAENDDFKKVLKEEINSVIKKIDIKNIDTKRLKQLGLL